jgi:hypothetical protein
MVSTSAPVACAAFVGGYNLAPTMPQRQHEASLCFPLVSVRYSTVEALPWFVPLATAQRIHSQKWMDP